MDNVFIERLWRSLKYEEVYLHAYASVAEATAGIGRRSRHVTPKASRRSLRRRHKRRGLQVRRDIIQRLPHAFRAKEDAAPCPMFSSICRL
jgi:hypothetical protein